MTGTSAHSKDSSGSLVVLAAESLEKVGEVAVEGSAVAVQVIGCRAGAGGAERGSTIAADSSSLRACGAWVGGSAAAVQVAATRQGGDSRGGWGGWAGG